MGRCFDGGSKQQVEHSYDRESRLLHLMKRKYVALAPEGGERLSMLCFLGQITGPKDARTLWRWWTTIRFSRRSSQRILAYHRVRRGNEGKTRSTCYSLTRHVPPSGSVLPAFTSGSPDLCFVKMQIRYVVFVMLQALATSGQEYLTRTLQIC
jgi:hypothetical protein